MNKTTPAHTVLTIVTRFFLLYYFLGCNWLLYTSIIVGLLGVFIRPARVAIDFLWMKLAWILSPIVPRIILTVLYFLILTPIALLSRVFGKQSLKAKHKDLTSTFTPVDKTFEASSFERMF
jgi:hypothetical protein